MRADELMIPRYKVIADWFDMLPRFSIGYIFEHPYGRQYFTETSKDDPADYPHLFRKLEWWEDRKLEDMPEYVHFKDGRFEKYLKVHEHLVSKGWCLVAYPKDRILVDYPYSTLTPATEEEYKAYLTQSSARTPQ